MAKLKCWKKEGKDRWINKKGQKSIMVQTFSAHDDVVVNKFDFRKSLNDGGIKQIGKDDFGSEESARKFANKYMKSHDTC